MRKLINEEIKLNQDNDELAISMLSQKPVNIVKIITKRTGLEEWTKIVMYQVYSDISYEELVNQFVAEKYTIQDELAIQRKYKKGVNTSDFDEYDAYVEDCKVRAKAFIKEREEWLNDVR